MANPQSISEAEFFLPSDFLSEELFSSYNEEKESSSVASMTNNLMRQSFFENDKSSVLATSPQSALSGIGSWSFNSNNGSPEGASLVSSPPSTPFRKSRDEALDLLYKASNRVDMLRLGENQLMGSASNQELIQQQLQAARFYQLRRLQLLRQQQQLYLAAMERKRRINAAVNGCQPLSLSWPSLQKQTQGDDRTAVLVNGGARRQSIGTGVFLPRRTGTPFEPRKKPAGPNVFLPARVVQALNLNVDELNFNPRSHGIYHYENGGYTLNERIKKNYPGTIATAASENKLPQEWTY